MINCKHRWAGSPSDAGEVIYCTRCGDMENVTALRKQLNERGFRDEHWKDRYRNQCRITDTQAAEIESLRKRLEAVEALTIDSEGNKRTSFIWPKELRDALKREQE